MDFLWLEILIVTCFREPMIIDSLLEFYPNELAIVLITYNNHPCVKRWSIFFIVKLSTCYSKIFLKCDLKILNGLVWCGVLAMLFGHRTKFLLVTYPSLLLSKEVQCWGMAVVQCWLHQGEIKKSRKFEMVRVHGLARIYVWKAKNYASFIIIIMAWSFIRDRFVFVVLGSVLSGT